MAETEDYSHQFLYTIYPTLSQVELEACCRLNSKGSSLIFL
jgi:hypothetical protein